MVELLDAVDTDEKTYLFMELCEFDLKSFVEQFGLEGKRLCEIDAKRVTRHVLRGLCHMQERC